MRRDAARQPILDIPICDEPATADIEVIARSQLAEVAIGDDVRFEVKIRNNEQLVGVNDIVVDIALSGNVANVRWTCDDVNDAVCPAPSGSGPITHTIDLPAYGAGMTFAVEGTVASAGSGYASVHASAAPPSGGVPDPFPANNVATLAFAVFDPVTRIFRDGFEREEQ